MLYNYSRYTVEQIHCAKSRHFLNLAFSPLLLTSMKSELKPLPDSKSLHVGPRRCDLKFCASVCLWLCLHKVFTFERWLTHSYMTKPHGPMAGHSQCSGLVKIWFTSKKNNELIFIQCGNRMCHIFLKYPPATFLPVLMKTAVILEILVWH